MPLNSIITKNSTVVKKATTAVAKSFSNSPLPGDDVLDMSINGLQFKQIGAAIINHFKLGSSNPAPQPLGRWKIEVDNFAEGKKYTYDHSSSP